MLFERLPSLISRDRASIWAAQCRAQVGRMSRGWTRTEAS